MDDTMVSILPSGEIIIESLKIVCDIIRINNKKISLSNLEFISSSFKSKAVKFEIRCLFDKFIITIDIPIFEYSRLNAFPHNDFSPFVKNDLVSLFRDKLVDTLDLYYYGVDRANA